MTLAADTDVDALAAFTAYIAAIQEVKKIVWRVIVYYNRRRITTMNPKGYPPAIYRELFETGLLKPAA